MGALAQVARRVPWPRAQRMATCRRRVWVPLLEQQLFATERVVRYLLNVRALDPQLRDVGELIWPEPTPIDEERQPLLSLLQDQGHGSLLCYCYGPYGSGRRQLAGHFPLAGVRGDRGGRRGSP